MKQLSLYIHIPFCVQICKYCDFASCKYKDEAEMQNYINVLNKEFEARLPEFKTVEAPSIYFGGGTPSLLKPKHLDQIFHTLARWVKWDKKTEITLEANPQTLNTNLIKNWVRHGINRISLGAQSFNNNTLETIGRLHKEKDIKESFFELKENGIENINIDLIYALPNESVSNFNHSVTETLKLNPTHISLYQLAIEEKTIFHHLQQKGELPLPSEEKTMQMYELALKELKRNGFVHYELQNFSKPHYKSTHNLRYWNLEEFLGFGVGAYSYVSGKRFGNTKKIKQYLNRISENNFEAETSEEISDSIKLKEKIILGLRLKDGIDSKILEGKGFEIPRATLDQLGQLVKEGLVKNEKSRWQLTLKGEHLSESVASRLV